MRRDIRGDTKVYIEIEAKCSSGQNELNKKVRIFNMLCVCVFFLFYYYLLEGKKKMLK